MASRRSPRAEPRATQPAPFCRWGAFLVPGGRLIVGRHPRPPARPARSLVYACLLPSLPVCQSVLQCPERPNHLWGCPSRTHAATPAMCTCASISSSSSLCDCESLCRACVSCEHGDAQSARRLLRAPPVTVVADTQTGSTYPARRDTIYVCRYTVYCTSVRTRRMRECREARGQLMRAHCTNI